MNVRMLLICCVNGGVHTITFAVTAYASRERASVSCTPAAAGSTQPFSVARPTIREEWHRGCQASAARDRRIAAIRLGGEAGFAPSRMPSIRPWTTFIYRSLKAKTNETMFHLFRFVRPVPLCSGDSVAGCIRGSPMEAAGPSNIIVAGITRDEDLERALRTTRRKVQAGNEARTAECG